MLNDHYDVDISSDFLTFEFESVGSKGRITKVVRYTEINVRGFYNLGFGDKYPVTGYISDLTVTNNADKSKSIGNCSGYSLCVC